jgi:hypothetical protein
MMKKSVLIFVLIVAVALIVLLRRGSQTLVDSPKSAPAVQNQVSVPEELSDSKTVLVSNHVESVSEKNTDPVLSDMVQQILSDEASYMDRARAIKELGRNLSADDIAALRSFLLISPEDSAVRPIALNSLKNDVLEVLMDQIVMPEALGQQIVDMFNNPNSDYMWREYCLQFMEPLHEKRISNIEQGTPNAEVVSNELQVVRQTLFSALDERDEDLAGTALLGLNRLVRDGREIDSDAVTAKAIEIAADGTASERCRLTAMRIAASKKNPDVLPAARDLVQNAKTDLLKAAAITTLGDFADPQDKSLLTKLAASGNRQIASAAKKALTRYSD